MSEVIGTTAGKVWHYLKKNGPATLPQIQKGIGARAEVTNQAVGWLAREGKLKICRDKKATEFQLTE